MRFGSICSGIEAVSAAWLPLGWECGFVSEIDPFCNAVLAHHYPEVPNHGDFTTIGAGAAAIDILVGGTPCQSFSVAGLRGGMADDRGNLALEFIKLADRLCPRWVVWENVPGVLSSNEGKDFGAFLGGLAECGYGFAYRVLDAQYFGVAQRRRRVFVVGYLGDWRRASAVLFERASLSGNPPPSRETGESAAKCLTSGASNGGYRLDPTEETLVAHTLRAEGSDASEDGTGRDVPIIAFSCKDSGNDAGDLSPTLRAMEYDGSHMNDGGQVAVMLDTYGLQGYNKGIGGQANASTLEANTRTVLHLLREKAGAQAFTEWGLGVLDSLQSSEVLRSGLHGEGLRSTAGERRSGLDDSPLPREEIGSTSRLCTVWESECVRRASQEWELDGQLSDELRAYLSQLSHEGASRPVALRCLWEASEGLGVLRQALSTLQEIRRPSDEQAESAHPNHQAGRLVVRRLTPREAERLQGFPDDYSLVPYRGKPATDSPRYRALGNSMAVPVMRWIGRRIQAVSR